MSHYLSALDRALKKVGSSITLRRVYGTAQTPTHVDVAVRAVVRSPTAREISSGMQQSDSVVIMSPSEIAAAAWPGGEAPSLTVPDPSLPRRNDKVIVDGRSRNVDEVNPIRVADQLVRIELRVTG